jgi:endonuclease-3
MLDTHSLAKESEKLPFDIPKMFRLIAESIEPYAPATLFDLYQQGHTTPFEQLMACVLSIRTRDETSLVAAQKLFKVARTPREILKIPREELIEIIEMCTFPGQKASTLKTISEIVIKKFDGVTPCDFEGLTSLPGIGPKCANLVLGIACHVPRIGVDIHVHRVTNRWGYVHTSTPEKSMFALEEKLPKKYWVKINELLVPFGKHICLGTVPKCSTCPVLKYCRQVGVRKHQ